MASRFLRSARRAGPQSSPPSCRCCWSGWTWAGRFPAPSQPRASPSGIPPLPRPNPPSSARPNGRRWKLLARSSAPRRRSEPRQGSSSYRTGWSWLPPSRSGAVEAAQWWWYLSLSRENQKPALTYAVGGAARHRVDAVERRLRDVVLTSRVRIAHADTRPRMRILVSVLMGQLVGGSPNKLAHHSGCRVQKLARNEKRYSRRSTQLSPSRTWS